MKNFWVRGLLAGFPMLVVGIVYMALTNFLFPAVAAQYQNPNLFYAMTDWHMQSMPIYYFVLGVVLAFAWDKLRALNLTPVQFALGYFLVAGIPGMLITWMTFMVSTAMIVTWLVNGLLEALVAGYALKMMDKKIQATVA